MKKVIKIFLIFSFILFLFTPMIQSQFSVFNYNAELFGAFVPPTDTSFSYSTWKSGVYQSKKENYLNENFGFRNLLVKIHNQIDYAIYQDINLLDVFKGKNDYLFNSSFFNTYSGRNFKGTNYADSVFNEVKQLNDWLVSRNKKLLICIAPCKESYYSEYLPDSCISELKKENYYSYYKQKLQSNHIPLLDYNDYFLKLKPDSPYPLFTHGAVHWTTYGTYIALDTLLKRISYEINKKTYQIGIKSVSLSDTAKFSDDDITKTMNLLFKVKTEKLAYPVSEYVNIKDSCYMPKVIIVGDSYYSTLNNTWIPVTLFSKESYFLYYYIRSIPYDSKKEDLLVKYINMKKELENTDIVILFYNIGRLSDFPNGSTSMIK